MQLYNLKHPDERVNFVQALKQGLGRNRGLFFPTMIPELADIDQLLSLPFVERSQRLLGAWLADELGQNVVDAMVTRAFNFPVPVVEITPQLSVLELFHGPTLAFKDFGARFMAQCLSNTGGDKKITILTATSGDTGAAVAAAFYGLPGVEVVILYPEGRISTLQEKMFCTLGGNIRTIAVDSDFDTCQDLVKQAFSDAEINRCLNLNSANSINISRLLAQICYYFEAVARARQAGHNDLVISVPSGNFGDLTAGLLAQAMGLPVKRFIAATNSNDTVPRYLQSGLWQPAKTVATMSNAMDVAEPNNWPRIEAICQLKGYSLSAIQGIAISEADTAVSLRHLQQLGYLADPHAAVAAAALKDSLRPGEHGIFLGTAHPAKFKAKVDEILQTSIPLPHALQQASEKSLLSEHINPDFTVLKNLLCQHRS